MNTFTVIVIKDHVDEVTIDDDSEMNVVRIERYITKKLRDSYTATTEYFGSELIEYENEQELMNKIREFFPNAQIKDERSVS